MKKRIIAVILTLVLLMSMPVFAYANAIAINVNDAVTHKAENLTGNNLAFNATVTGATSVKFTIDGTALSSFYNDSEIRYYTFTFNKLSVRADKNNFYDFNLARAEFELTERSFTVKYYYNDLSSKLLATVNIPMRYTLTGANFTTHTVAKFSSQTVNCIESTAEKFSFETELTGSFTPVKFEFNDVKNTSSWYYSYVNESGAYGLVSGTGNGSFSPQKQVTRAEIAAMIVNATQHIISYRSDESISFSDVSKSSWYYPFVNKCATMGIMNGMGNGTFEPTKPATREEIATVAANLTLLLGSFNGQQIPQVNADTAKTELSAVYTDAADVSGWAASFVLICNKLEIMVGSNGKFDAKRDVTRAESAKIFNDLYFKTSI